MASAGSTDKVIPVNETDVSLPDELQVKGEKDKITTSNYDIYKVIGDSLCTTHVFSGDYVLTERFEKLEDALNGIPSWSNIVLKVDKDREKRKNIDNPIEHKLRSFITFLDLRIQDNETLFSLVISTDIRSRFQGSKERFMSKISEAREFFQEKVVILSSTYKDGEKSRDYSFHGLDSLLGIVKYQIRPENLNEAIRVLTINDEPKIFQEVVEYISKNKINRSFYGTTDEQAIIILSEIFKQSKEYIRLVSNRLATEITSDERYLNALRLFLDKNNTKLDIFVYSCEKDNPIYDFLSSYRSKVCIKTNSKGLTFKLADRIINFCVGDNTMYRIETDTDLRMSECNLSDKNISEFFISQFCQVFDNSENETIE